MNRGSEPVRSGCSHRTPRFNEAPIHESGKFPLEEHQDRYRAVLQ